MSARATENQEKLFAMMAEFSTNTVLGWVSMIYKSYGAKVAAVSTPHLVIKFAERYFNYCAYMIYKREDNYLNEKFDEMLAVPLARRYDPIDILHLIVMLSLAILQKMDIKDVANDNYHSTMKITKLHLEILAAGHKGLAAELHGCPEDHVHEPVGANERIFTFGYDKYVVTDSGPVKLSDI